MTPEIIDLLFPNVLPTPEEIEARYPARQLPEGAVVSRLAPSPTGYLHIGNFYQGFLAERLAHQNKGVFFLRVEDTDQKRRVDGAVQVVLKALAHYHVLPDEGAQEDGSDKGSYGPYTQSLRKDIYQAYAKELVKKGLAYPCFCTSEDLDLMRKVQEKQGLRTGYYGKYAKCRDLSDEEVLANLKAGKPWILRFKSNGDYDKRLVFEDLLKGKLSLPENNIDHVIIKGDGLPTYHFAHVVDDHLMKTTHVVRGEEWVPSVPLHLQLFALMGWTPPKYAHHALLQKLDNGKRRKISKRYDPEANIEYFAEHGYPQTAVLDYLQNLMNANFEEWRKTNPLAPTFDFPVNFSKISNTAGALFDFVKLHSICREVIANMTAEEVYNNTLTWAEKFNVPLADLMKANPDKVKAILNIERGIGTKSRKDLMKWEDVENEVSYFFTKPALDSENLKPLSMDEVRTLASEYANMYSVADDKDAWFGKIKELAVKFGFADNMKEYKANPDNYKGSVADVARILRVLMTGRTQSPDLFAIMQVMGVGEVKKRLTEI
ncbi:MAG: glutamate--tRNA ligase [Alphaproteobacteria bacterium]|nr:glutamate--tRNA ligase [Alphaproteobacteria bacterium]